MSNRDLLKEAIADAKAVKEMAISNAKAALEEAFTPQLKSMLEKKLQEMDEADTVKEELNEETLSEEELNEILEELNEEDLINDPKTTSTAHGNIAEEEKEEVEEEEEEVEDEDDEEEEEIDLEDMTEEDLKAFIEDVVDEMIAAGELEAGDEEMEAPEEEMEVTDEESEEVTDEEPMMEGKEEKMEEVIDPTGADFQGLADALGVTLKTARYIVTAAGFSLPFVLGLVKYFGSGVADYIRDKFKSKTGKDVEDVKDQEVSDDMMETMHDEDKMEEVETLQEFSLADIPDIVEKGRDILNTVGITNVHNANMVLAGLAAGGTLGGAALLSKVRDFAKSFKSAKVKKEEVEMEEGAYDKKEMEEALATVETLKAELNEVNLLNSKLLYTNKIFKAKNLTEAQKVKVLTTFDKAETVKEVKLVYETLLEGLVSTSAPKEAIKESKSFASKAVGVSPKQPVMETNDMVNRFKKLAGIK